MATTLPNIRAPHSKRLRRFIAKYIRYVEVIGYGFVILATLGIIACWVIEVDDVAKADGTPAIKPRTEILKDVENDVVVVKVLVKTHADVKAGQPLLKVCRDPQWVKQLKAMQPLEDAQRALRELEQNSMMESLTAPIAGIVDGVKDLEGRVIEKGKDIARVLDFDDLRLTVKLIGENVPKARAGQKAYIELLPDFGRESVYVRGEVQSSALRNNHVQFNDLLDATAKDVIKKKMEDKTLTLREDIPLKFSDVLNVWVDATIVPQQVSDETPALQDESLQNLTPLRGTLVEGKHTGKVELRDVPEDVSEALRPLLMEKLKDKVASADGKSFRVVDVQNVHPIIQFKIETPDPQVSDEELESQLQNAYVAAKIERFYEGAVKLDDPPAELKSLVRRLQLADKPTDVKVNLWVAVARRRVAMLLFRR
jgi:hypothetical protein